MQFEMPEALAASVARYDLSRGAYKCDDGSWDTGPTEVELLYLWHNFARCIKARTIVETGTYLGHATSFLAAAIAANGLPNAKVYTIDPYVQPRLYENTWLADYITYLPHTSQDAAKMIGALEIDILIIDSIHTYEQSSWELTTFEPRVREGGYVIMHDSLLFDGVGRTAQHLLDSPRFEVMTFETPRTQAACNIAGGRISMGCTIARKIRAGAPFSRDPAWLPVPEQTPTGPDGFLRIRALEKSGL